MSRSDFLRFGAVLASSATVAGMFLGTAHCGLLASPGDYTGGIEAQPNAADASTADVLVPDAERAETGEPSPTSSGTLLIAAGQGEPAPDDDDPTLASDVWSATLDAKGHPVAWNVEPNAPIVGAFDSSGLSGNTWLVTSRGASFGGVDSALQTVTWGPGIRGGWRASAFVMPGGLDEPTRAVVGSRVVTVGGIRYSTVDGGTVATFTKEVHVAAADLATGTLGAFGSSVQSLAKERSRPSVILDGSHLYVIGGRAPGGVTGAVDMANVNVAEGKIEPFTSQASLKIGEDEHGVYRPAVVVTQGFLFVAGGSTNYQYAPTDVVLASKIDAATGALGAFAAVTKLPKPLRDFGFLAHRGRLYVVGGTTASPTDGSAAVRTDEVFSATIGADGTLGVWETESAKLPEKRSQIVGLAY